MGFSSGVVGSVVGVVGSVVGSVGSVGVIVRVIGKVVGEVVGGVDSVGNIAHIVNGGKVVNVPGSRGGVGGVGRGVRIASVVCVAIVVHGVHVPVRVASVVVRVCVTSVVVRVVVRDRVCVTSIGVRVGARVSRPFCVCVLHPDKTTMMMSIDTTSLDITRRLLGKTLQLRHGLGANDGNTFLVNSLHFSTHVSTHASQSLVAKVVSTRNNGVVGNGSSQPRQVEQGRAVCVCVGASILGQLGG